MTKEQFFAQKFHEARQKSMANGNNNVVYTFEMISILNEMARKDVYPNGSFGDDDCNIWSMMRR